MKLYRSILSSLCPAKASKAAVVVAGMSLAGMTAPSQGGIFRNNAEAEQARVRALDYGVGGSALQGGGTGALRLNPTPGFAFPSNASITFLNSRWGAACLHEFTPYLNAGGTISGNVQTGNNYNTSPGITSQILRIVPFPGGSATNPALADFCLVEFNPIAGITDAVLGTFPGVGQNVSMAGYGRWVAGGVDNGRDGNRRQWNAPIQSFLTGGYSATYYAAAQVDSTNSLSSLGRGYTGDSGGGVYDSQGRTLGIIVAGTTGLQFNGNTTVLRFDNPEINSFITSTIPSPGTAGLLGMAAVLAFRRNRAQ